MNEARKRMVVTGREGQIATSLIERGSLGSRFDVIAIGRPELDLSRPETIDRALRAAKPDVIVSAAAYTAVDQAEMEEDAATVVNGVAAGAIAKTSASLGIPVIHVSTDYVFDGIKVLPYAETDPVAPIGAYGRSKLAGERAVADATENYAILRTAWVYSPFGKNFLKTILRLAETRESLDIVDDQIGNPTSALDIADAILVVASNLIDSADPGLRGIFHLTGSGEGSWADFAVEVLNASVRRGGPGAVVSRIPSSFYPTPAKRPANSRLDCSLLEDRHGVRLPDWKRSITNAVTRLDRGRI